MCSPTRKTNIPRDVCFLGKEKDVTKNMCFPGRETHILSDIFFFTQEADIPSDMCSPTRKTNIPSNNYVDILNSASGILQC